MTGFELIGNHRSVAEVADPGDEHRPADRVHGRDGLGIAHGAAGLGERRDAGGQADLQRIRKREKGI